MKQGVVAGWLVMLLVCGKCFAVDSMEQRAAQLASALGVSTNATLQTRTHHLFASNETVVANQFRVMQKRVVSSGAGQQIDVNILDVSGDVIAAGRVLECASFEMARQALFANLVCNSMGIEDLIQKYELRAGEAGEFCIVQKTFDKASRKYTSNPAVIHFVRGGTVVSLYPVGTGKDIREVEKALDAVLLKITGTDKTPDGK